MGLTNKRQEVKIFSDYQQNAEKYYQLGPNNSNRQLIWSVILEMFVFRENSILNCNQIMNKYYKFYASSRVKTNVNNKLIFLVIN